MNSSSIKIYVRGEMRRSLLQFHDNIALQVSHFHLLNKVINRIRDNSATKARTLVTREAMRSGVRIPLGQTFCNG